MSTTNNHDLNTRQLPPMTTIDKRLHNVERFAAGLLVIVSETADERTKAALALLLDHFGTCTTSLGGFEFDEFIHAATTKVRRPSPSPSPSQEPDAGPPAA